MAVKNSRNDLNAHTVKGWKKKIPLFSPEEIVTKLIGKDLRRRAEDRRYEERCWVSTSWSLGVEWSKVEVKGLCKFVVFRYMKKEGGAFLSFKIGMIALRISIKVSNGIVYDLLK